MIPENIIELSELGLKLKFRQAHTALMVAGKAVRYSAVDLVKPENAELLAQIVLQKAELITDPETGAKSVHPASLTDVATESGYERRLTSTFVVVAETEPTDTTPKTKAKK